MMSKILEFSIFELLYSDKSLFITPGFGQDKAVSLFCGPLISCKCLQGGWEDYGDRKDNTFFILSAV